MQTNWVNIICSYHRYNLHNVSPIPACSHKVEEVKKSEKIGDLVQPGKAPAENAPPLPLTEEHCLPVLPPLLFLDLGPSPLTSCCCSAGPKHLQSPQQAEALPLNSCYFYLSIIKVLLTKGPRIYTFHTWKLIFLWQSITLILFDSRNNYTSNVHSLQLEFPVVKSNSRNDCYQLYFFKAGDS